MKKGMAWLLALLVASGVALAAEIVPDTGDVYTSVPEDRPAPWTAAELFWSNLMGTRHLLGADPQAMEAGDYFRLMAAPDAVYQCAEPLAWTGEAFAGGEETPPADACAQIFP